MGVRNIGDNEGEIGEWDKFDKENRMRKQISNENKIENGSIDCNHEIPNIIDDQNNSDECGDQQYNFQSPYYSFCLFDCIC